MVKFIRSFKLVIQASNGRLIQIGLPFTVDFDIERNQLNSANVASFRIYNLNPDTRSQLCFNQWDVGEFRAVYFSAGYGDQPTLSFSGGITQAFSVREGVNMVTQVECFGAGFDYVNAVTDLTVPSGNSTEYAIKELIKSLPNTKIGAVGSFPGTYDRAASFTGNTIQRLVEMTGGAFFIDNGFVNCLSDKEALDVPIIVINSGSGLLGSPTREQQYINFEMLFEPGLRVGQLIRLESESVDVYNGTHKVLTVRDHGTISAAVCGNAITSVGLLPGTVVANGFLPVPLEK